MTPEKKVKNNVVKLLKDAGAYYFYPVASGYGASGVPDIVACIHGRFIGVECKANGGKPTALQEKNLMDIMNTGGIAVLVDETGMDKFKHLLKVGFPKAGVIYDMLDGEKYECGVQSQSIGK
jgi:hypothetical protein